MPSTFGTCGDGSHIVAFVGDETAGFGEAEGLGEQGVVANFGVAVEREVGAIDCQIAVESGFYLLIAAAGEWNRCGPVEPVVADQEVDLSGDGLLKGDLAGIHGGGDFGDFAVILDLQAVVGAGEVFDFGSAGAGITEGDDLGKR